MFKNEKYLKGYNINRDVLKKVVIKKNKIGRKERK